MLYIMLATYLGRSHQLSCCNTRRQLQCSHLASRQLHGISSLCWKGNWNERQDSWEGKVTIHGCGLPDSRTPGLPDSRTPRLPDSRTPGLPDSRTPGLLDSQSPGLPDCQISGLPWNERLCCWGAPHIFQMKYLANMSGKVEL